MTVSAVTDRAGWLPPPEPPMPRHTVALHDTLGGIARQYGLTPEALLSANPQIANPDVLYPGDALALPGRVEVGAGQTLSEIARDHGASLEATIAANPGLADPHRIEPGQLIALPGAHNAPLPPSTPDVATPGVPTSDIATPGAVPASGDSGQTPAANDDHVPGGLSEQYETSGRGPGTVSTGEGDPGGVSYGSYQLATNRGRPQEFIANEGAPWAAEFGNAAPGTAAFSDAWRAVAAREPEAFAQAQHAFIQRTHYDVQMDRIERNTGIDLRTHAPAVRDAVWSTAVQHGPQTPAITRAMADVEAQGLAPADGDTYDRALIDAIYDERGRRGADGALVYFGSAPVTTQESVADRFVRERADAHAMFDAG